MFTAFGSIEAGSSWIERFPKFKLIQQVDASWVQPLLLARHYGPTTKKACNKGRWPFWAIAIFHLGVRSLRFLLGMRLPGHHQGMTIPIPISQQQTHHSFTESVVYYGPTLPPPGRSDVDCRPREQYSEYNRLYCD